MLLYTLSALVYNFVHLENTWYTFTLFLQTISFNLAMYKNRQEFLKKRYVPVANRTISYQGDPRLKVVLSFLAKCNSVFQMEAKNSVKLLDIGCYDGHIAFLLKICLGNCEAYGIDIAKKTIVLARQKGIHAKICDMEPSYSLPEKAAGHIRYFTFETLKELLLLHKFEPIAAFSDTVTFPGFLFDVPAKIFPTLGRSIISFSRNSKKG